MKAYESMKINGNRGNSWSPNSLSFFLTSHLTRRKQLEYLCRRMSRENVSSDMWWLQAGPSSPVAYVVGGRVGMDETHQVKIHFNWDNLSLFSLSLFLISILFLAGRVGPTPDAVPPLCHFRPENLHSVRGCPKKVEKTSSENTTFENSEHPYRTCGSSGWFFYLFGSSPMSVFLWKTNDFLKSCSNLWCSFGKQLIFIDYHWNLEVSYEKQMICQDSCSNL